MDDLGQAPSPLGAVSSWHEAYRKKFLKVRPEDFLDEQTLGLLLTTQIPGSQPRSAESGSLGGVRWGEGKGYTFQQGPQGDS